MLQAHSIDRCAMTRMLTQQADSASNGTSQVQDRQICFDISVPIVCASGASVSIVCASAIVLE